MGQQLGAIVRLELRKGFFGDRSPLLYLLAMAPLGCVAIFGNLIRREMLDRSLHYFFLSPVRRELLVVGKSCRWGCSVSRR